VRGDGKAGVSATAFRKVVVVRDTAAMSPERAEEWGSAWLSGVTSSDDVSSKGSLERPLVLYDS
jgi:hypothetical protein